MTERDVLELAIEIYGADNQERVAVEECCELCVAINHKQRGREHNIAEEIADVEIMLEQLNL
jgi:NTP pyrophosphatase (non-canonical NTP hydrolase)